MVRVVRTGIRHVVQHVLSAQPILLRNCKQPLRPESALCVDVQGFPLPTVVREG